jgi:ABC-type Fe3+ transport system substrate-binding protein
MIRHLAVLAVVALLIAAPLALRDRPLRRPDGETRLVIITPHGEDIRREFTDGFRAWAKRERGLDVDIDWRTPGGTSEITRFIDDRFRAAFAEKFPQHRGQLAYFTNPKLAADSPAEQKAARADFLASDVGISTDLLFGGGELPFRNHADKGYLVDSGLQRAEPTWFSGAEPLIPQVVSGETVYDPKGRYYGACFGVFGIAYSPDRVAELGLPVPPVSWLDLAAPAYRRQITLTDPTKSGAAATTFERILQQRMAAHPGDLPAGWSDGHSLIKRLVANARWITDSASKPTRDAVRGDAAAGMAIDFQAKIEAESAALASAAQAGGTSTERLRFVVPLGGTSVSADPIAVFRGAPHRELAAEFLHFVLSPEGQRLWSQRRGTPGGPRLMALRRFPVRRDLTGPAAREWRSDPDEDPFAIANGFTYHREWTGRYFNLVSSLVKTVAIDPREELGRAWDAITRAGGPERVPEAWEQFCWLPVSYGELPAAQEQIDAWKRTNPALIVQQQREWLEQATLHYRLAAAYAEAGR